MSASFIAPARRGAAAARAKTLREVCDKSVYTRCRAAHQKSIKKSFSGRAVFTTFILAIRAVALTTLECAVQCHLYAAYRLPVGRCAALRWSDLARGYARCRGGARARAARREGRGTKQREKERKAVPIKNDGMAGHTVPRERREKQLLRLG